MFRTGVPKLHFFFLFLIPILLCFPVAHRISGRLIALSCVVVLGLLHCCSSIELLAHGFRPFRSLWPATTFVQLYVNNAMVLLHDTPSANANAVLRSIVSCMLLFYTAWLYFVIRECSRLLWRKCLASGVEFSNCSVLPQNIPAYVLLP